MQALEINRELKVEVTNMVGRLLGKPVIHDIETEPGVARLVKALQEPGDGDDNGLNPS